jgi:hypothetical protein
MIENEGFVWFCIESKCIRRVPLRVLSLSLDFLTFECAFCQSCGHLISGGTHELNTTF